jgi:excisionase family DNA binding protein
MPSVDPDALLTADELAARLRVKPTTVFDWYRTGRIPARKLSHKVLRFDLAEVVAALESRHENRQTGKGPGVVS